MFGSAAFAFSCLEAHAESGKLRSVQAPTGFFCELDIVGLPCASAFLRSLRLRIRRASFCLRMRLNLDLSPLARDMMNSCHSVLNNR
jgi:hypothetical protein